MHWDSISDLATLGMWADPGSYAYADDQHEIDPEVARRVCTERVQMLLLEPIRVVARATENRHHLLEREHVLQPLAQDPSPARTKYKNTF